MRGEVNEVHSFPILSNQHFNGSLSGYFKVYLIKSGIKVYMKQPLLYKKAGRCNQGTGAFPEPSFFPANSDAPPRMTETKFQPSPNRFRPASKISAPVIGRNFAPNSRDDVGPELFLRRLSQTGLWKLSSGWLRRLENSFALSVDSEAGSEASEAAAAALCFKWKHLCGL